MTIDDVLARLTAGLDEDERIARDALYPDPTDHIDFSPAAYLAARFDARRVLRQVEATRRVIADYHDARDALNGLNDNQLSWEERARVNALESTLSALAGIYTDETEKS